MSTKTIGVVIPTCNAETYLPRILPFLVNSPLKPRILIVDSSSSDRTVDLAREFGAETTVIPRSEFNHGATREHARKLIGTDIVVMMTQDAVPVREDLLENLVKPLLNGEASISYARQIPRLEADIFEAFPRAFNYPAVSQIRGIEDVATYGVYTFFCSDSCAAWVNSALDEIGGFQAILTNEDYFAVARLLQKGHKIAYVADAVVRHSHSYTIWEEFKRYFDTGYVRAENPWVTEIVGNAESRGGEFFKALLRELVGRRPLLVPYAFLNTFVKWLGYRIGFFSYGGPHQVKKALSGQGFYWDSMYHKKSDGPLAKDS